MQYLEEGPSQLIPQLRPSQTQRDAQTVEQKLLTVLPVGFVKQTPKHLMVKEIRDESWETRRRALVELSN